MKNDKVVIFCFGYLCEKTWRNNWQRHQEIIQRLNDNFQLIYIKNLGYTDTWHRLKKILYSLKLILIKSNKNKGGGGLNQEQVDIKFYKLFVIPIFIRFFLFFNLILCIYQLNSLMKKFDGHKFLFWFSYPNPLFPYLVKKYNHIPSIYDCNQRYAYKKDFPKKYLKYEKLLSQLVTVIFADSQVIYNDKIVLNKKVYKISQGVNLKNACNHQSYQNINISKNDTESNIIGYVGSFNQALDIDLIKYLANKRKCYNFYLVGVGSKIKEYFKEFDNVLCFDHVDYTEIGYYIRNFSVCIIPYKINEFTQGVFPTKFLEYLSYFKPIVSTFLPDLIDYCDVVSIAYNYEDFLAKIDYHLQDKSFIARKKEKITEVLAKNTWDMKYNQIYASILNVLEEITF
ncbi:Glycosyltransferase involved in cell wall bisynthesis [Carboxydocella sporoproducens DSM 16521]|uniref:Glycosyltransferase involved in cell wall bisynthesis n=2 Tax=Carboxydocella TaxID=178898 RepID=A0A1T4L6J9_9FIRM|nr:MULTISPECIES: glycosyltransferase [Carboxydocella]AVX19940.1 Glycosyltransferase involved in cell wall bisynthesis [Carboxydocella thermautotrophica]SJZ50304.1 Glycosyltransferase involved in cell wall bisynthesis [Carboxydocella sporoproducens DSM 16521]